MKSVGLFVVMFLSVSILVGCPPLKFTSQPESQVVNPGQKVEFVALAPRAERFTWLKNGLNIAGAEEPVFVIPAAKESDEGGYQARASKGTGYVDSDVAYLTVNDPALIITDPVSVQVNAGGDAEMYIEAGGTEPLTYQWYRNSQPVIGAISNELLIEDAMLIDIGRYYCEVNNVVGQAAISGEAAVLLNGYPERGIAFTNVPVYGAFDNLYGVAFGVNPAEYKVAVYNESTWGYWIKYEVAYPDTFIDYGEIDSLGSNWLCDVTSGANDQFALGYVAFLIPIGLTPPLCTGNNGGWGGIACPNQPQIPEAIGEPAVVHRLEVRTIEAFGLTWEVKRADFPVDPGQHKFSDDETDVFVDGGNIHLISREDASVEIVSQDSFGYGTYIFQVQGIAAGHDVNRVLGLFIYELISSHAAHREIDALEIAMWGDLLNPDNAQHTLQPCMACPGCATCQRFTLDVANDFTTYLVWEAGRVEMRTYRGNHLSGVPPFTDLVSQWEYEGAEVPEPAEEKVRMNLWILTGEDPVEVPEEEVVITGFKHQAVAPWVGGVEPAVTIEATATEVTVGDSVTFTANATGTAPIAYLWRKDGEALAQTGQILVIDAAQKSDAGDYTCTVTNAFGTSDSLPISLAVVDSDPLITAQPQSQTVNPAATVILTVVASGGVAPLEYQWYKKVGLDSQPIVGATSSSLTLLSVGEADEGGYWCRVANATGPIKIGKKSI